MISKAYSSDVSKHKEDYILKKIDVTKENIYINSLEASDLYESMQGRPIKNDFIGMIPYSLESIKLREMGLKVKSGRNGKLKSYDIINVRFKMSVKYYEDITGKYDVEAMRENLSHRIENLENYEGSFKSEIKKQKYIIQNMSKMVDYLDLIKHERRSKIPINDLRELFYQDGFTFNNIEYVIYKRSGAKSRTGQCMFIKKQLKDKAIRWARLGMNLDGLSLDDGIDFPSLLAYESLVSSSIIGRIEIDVKNIFVITDVISKFKTDANVVRNNDVGTLSSVFKINHEMESDLFDGQSLLDISYFTGDASEKGSMLLRNHMFKSNANNTNIQLFLRDMCPLGMDYQKWQLEDMFGNMIYAKDIMLITTPNSVKALKFYKRKGSKAKMYEHWKNKIVKDGCLFGVCKFEKKSKRGYHDNGKILNRTSYQILNAMPFTYDEMKVLTKLEVNYISRLKNDDNVYLDYLNENANAMNSNNMLIDIYTVNKNIVNTKQFKNKRGKDINNHLNLVRKGKVRIKGDYCTICQNPKEMLYHTIGLLPHDDNILDYDRWKDHMELIGNQAHFTLHDYGGEYSVFRNPNTSPSNGLILENIMSMFINKYMNSTDNIIYTNAIKIEINRILSGQDVDSDTVVVFDNKQMLSVTRRCYGMYNVCDNEVSGKKNNYKVSTYNMAKIDNVLSKSQSVIGQVVNLGQLAMSSYWDEVYNNGDGDRAKEILRQVDICTILSEIAIDLAKKMYDVDFASQIKATNEVLNLGGIKPNFFTFVSQSKIKKGNLKRFDTSMDYLFDIMSKIDRVKSKTKPVDMVFILNSKKTVSTKKDKRQMDRVTIVIDKFSNSIKVAFATHNKNLILLTREDAKKIRVSMLEDSIYEMKTKLSKYKLTDETVGYIVKRLLTEDARGKYDGNSVALTYLNAIYHINRLGLLDSFTH